MMLLSPLRLVRAIKRIIVGELGNDVTVDANYARGEVPYISLGESSKGDGRYRPFTAYYLVTQGRESFDVQIGLHGDRVSLGLGKTPTKLARIIINDFIDQASTLDKDMSEGTCGMKITINELRRIIADEVRSIDEVPAEFADGDVIEDGERAAEAEVLRPHNSSGCVRARTL